MTDKANVFTAKYEVEDGYVGGSRPQSFKIRVSDHDFEGLTDAEIEAIYFEAVEEDMRQRILACNTNESDFVAWARQQMKGENDD